MNLIYRHFAWFGLQIHVGSNSKPSKTECVSPPAPGHFKPPALSFIPPPDPSSSLPLVPKVKQENEETKRKRRDSLYDDSEETKGFEMGDIGHITFTKYFKFL